MDVLPHFRNGRHNSDSFVSNTPRFAVCLLVWAAAATAGMFLMIAKDNSNSCWSAAAAASQYSEIVLQHSLPNVIRAPSQTASMSFSASPTPLGTPSFTTSASSTLTSTPSPTAFVVESRRVANCRCTEPGDGDACNQMLPSAADLGVYRKPGKGSDRCRVQTFSLGYDPAYQTTRRETIFPYHCCESVREIADWLIDEPHYGCPLPSPEEVQCGDIVFTHFTPSGHSQWFESIHPRVKNPYVVVSCGSDVTPPFHEKAAQALLDVESPMLWAWFGQNTPFEHPRLFPMNVGLPPAGFEMGRRYSSYFADPEEARLHMITKLHAFLDGKVGLDKLMVAAFSVGLNRAEREPALAAAKALGITEESMQIPTAVYAERLKEHVFALAPNGAGLDVHRATEAVSAGVVPILREGAWPTSYYDCWPVLLVPTWHQITMGWLRAAATAMLRRIEARQVDFRKAYAAYQVGRIRREAARAKEWCRLRDEAALRPSPTPTSTYWSRNLSDHSVASDSKTATVSQ